MVFTRILKQKVNRQHEIEASSEYFSNNNKKKIAQLFYLWLTEDQLDFLLKH